MSDPLLVNELEDEELRDQFNLLLEAMEGITTFDPNREEGAYEALNQRIHQKVTDQPILARIVNEMGKSLLSSACANLNLATSHRAIKSLIQAYPSALLLTITNDTDDLYTNVPIYMIVRHPEHCVLMPWIATNHTWVLDHERCLHIVFDLLDRYVERRTSCTASTVKQFLEAYPRAHTQVHESYGTILHIILQDQESECNADLFKWVAERFPSGTLLVTDFYGSTPLHLACSLLSKHKGRNSSEICQYLIQKCPESVRVISSSVGTTVGRVLPIHFLQAVSRYRFVRKVVVSLLREYPESYDVPKYQLPPSFFPFIQSIKPHLDEEKELKETAASLTNSTSSLTEAATCTNDGLMTSAFAVFDSWATSFINSTKDKLQQISMKLQEMCNGGLEPDDDE